MVYQLVSSVGQIIIHIQYILQKIYYITLLIIQWQKYIYTSLVTLLIHTVEIQNETYLNNQPACGLEIFSEQLV